MRKRNADLRNTKFKAAVLFLGRWHHHVTLCLLATWFLTKETMRGKKRLPVVDGPEESLADRRTGPPSRDAQVSRLDELERSAKVITPRTCLLLSLQIKKYPPSTKGGYEKIVPIVQLQTTGSRCIRYCESKRNPWSRS